MSRSIIANTKDGKEMHFRIQSDAQKFFETTSVCIKNAIETGSPIYEHDDLWYLDEELELNVEEKDS